MAAMARSHDPWLPTLLLRYPLLIDEALARVRSPVLLVRRARRGVHGFVWHGQDRDAAER